ncbi:uncharacterized protein LOC129584228 [Paramacrobiotus metropolitanus]|uniref:uncharacterized protein LOC129584228 n=1 Tax=Paramacrobiotus metropolitanus TaxID=2943436 RepID=UPI00244598B5|nr:uncharacterized protein LOC129584228 [Paramacrobiotus metropolitanus]
MDMLHQQQQQQCNQKQTKPKPFLIVFEGINTAEKTNGSVILADALANMGYNVSLHNDLSMSNCLTQPALPDLFRASVLALSNRDLVHTRATYLILSARRQILINDIRSNLADGNIVIVDRYILSDLAYGSARGHDMDWMKSIETSEGEATSASFIIPDLTFLWM